MKNGTIKKLLIYLLIAFLVVSIWQDPEGAAQTFGDFLGSVGNFFSEVIDRTATFIENLA